MSKQFGLIIPGQQKKEPAKPIRPPVRPSIFDESSNSSDSDNEAGAPKTRPSGKPGVCSALSLMDRRKARNMQEKALAEDPTIYQYDELYDEMDNKREEAKETKRQEPRKAKYIGRLMEHAERRKLENELRIDRQVQKDREAEGETYKDKDTYVTAAYRKKLESIRQLQEQDERDEYLEAIGDVTKQKDLDGFYRHLYEQKLGTQQPALKPKTAPSTSEVAYKPIKSDVTSTDDAAQKSIKPDVTSTGDAAQKSIKSDVASTSKQRSYRRRHSSDDDEKPVPVSIAPEVVDSSKAHLTNNIDADSDFSIDESSDEEQQKPNKKTKSAKTTTRIKSTSNTKKTDKTKQKQVDPKAKPTPRPEPKPESSASETESDSVKEPVESVPTVVKTPIDRSYIWRKRTVGEIFDAALARYHERKVARRA